MNKPLVIGKNGNYYKVEVKYLLTRLNAPEPEDVYLSVDNKNDAFTIDSLDLFSFKTCIL